MSVLSMAATGNTINFAGKVGFCIGTGRCGTTFLAELAGREPAVAAAHERERLGATFHMFCKWNQIPIDSAGFLAAKEAEIARDLEGRSFSFEASALLSHSLEELHDRFQACFLLLVRSPAETVASFAVRGWFLRTPARADVNLPPSYQSGEEARHFLGRNLPRGAEFERWARLSQIGRLAWFWQARNRAILEQFARLPLTHCRIQRLEDLDYSAYQQIAKFFGWPGEVNARIFEELSAARLNAGPNQPRRISDWTPEEIVEFETEVAPVALALGYEYRGDSLRQSSFVAQLHDPLPPLSTVLRENS